MDNVSNNKSIPEHKMNLYKHEYSKNFSISIEKNSSVIFHINWNIHLAGLQFKSHDRIATLRLFCMYVTKE